MSALYFSFALCASRAKRAMSSMVNPFAARKKSAITRPLTDNVDQVGCNAARQR